MEDPFIPWAPRPPVTGGKALSTAFRKTAFLRMGSDGEVFVRRTSRCELACYQWHLASALERRELPLCRGLQESLARTPCSLFLTVKEQAGPRKAGAVGKIVGQTGHLPFNSQEYIPSQRGSDSDKILPVESKNGFPISQGEMAISHWECGRAPNPFLDANTTGMRESHLKNK